MADENDNLANEVAEAVFTKIADTFVDFMSNIKDGQIGIAESLNRINARLESAENKVSMEEKKIIDIELWEKQTDEWKSRKKIRIDRMEIEMSLLQPNEIKKYVDEIHAVKPVMERLVRAFKWWKILLYIIALSILVFAAVAFSHRHGLLGQYRNSSIEMIDADIKTGKILPYTRAIHENRLSDTQIDTVQAGILKYNIKPVTITYDKR
jgi:hypothetical protein